MYSEMIGIGGQVLSCIYSSVKMLGEVRDPKESSFPACTENITVTRHLFALVRF